MGLSDDDKLNVLDRIKRHWLDAAAARWAYVRRAKRARTTSTWLGYATIGTAVLTALSGALSETVWLTASIGVVTAATASVRQFYTPQESFQNFFNCQIKLREIKDGIVDFAMSLSKVAALEDAQEVLAEIGKQINGVLGGAPELIGDDDRRAADEEYDRGSALKTIVQRHCRTAPAPAGETPVMPYDATGVVAMVRSSVD